MSKCCCNNDSKFFARPNAGICDACHPSNTMTTLEATAMCPPIGEPKSLTMLAPAVFDECGINLCRVICTDQLVDVCQNPTSRTTDILFDGLTRRDLEAAEKLQLQVVDIDFNFICPKSCRYSEIKATKGNPNLTRVTLKDIDVTFAVKVLDSCCKVCKEGMMTVRYLPGENCPGYDEETNPNCVSFDLYTPYGVSYAPENPAGCNKLVPTINYMGFVENQHCYNCVCEDDEMQKIYRRYDANNSLRQGISAQALAKVIAYDENCFAIGLTLYIKSIYFVQYKFAHQGLVVPPKFSPNEDESNNSCLGFVKGDLLEPCIQPLDVSVAPKCFKKAGCEVKNEAVCGYCHQSPCCCNRCQ
ncbi:MAG: hypothetical protein AB9856_09145 [Cellulosilyticaceae bacterium]